MMAEQSPTTIPHPPCRTPGECRREQICLDAWACSVIAKSAPQPITVPTWLDDVVIVPAVTKP
jgi:hypothetical protein